MVVVVVTARSLRVPRPGCLARVEREVEHPNVRVNDRGDVLGGLVDELDPEAAVARAGEPIYVRGARLRLRIEDGVAAAHVGEHEVVLAVAAAEVHHVRFARVAAVLVGAAVREEATEDAVFGVENGKVLVDDALEGVHIRAAPATIQ